MLMFVPLSPERLGMYPDTPRISSAELEKQRSHFDVNRSYCGSITLKRKTFVLSDATDIVKIKNPITDVKENHEILALRYIEYCDECVKLSEKSRECNRCLKWFTPGCNIRFLCLACFTLNRDRPIFGSYF